MGGLAANISLNFKKQNGGGIWEGRGMGGLVCGGLKTKAIPLALVDVLRFDKIVLVVVATMFSSQLV